MCLLTSYLQGEEREALEYKLKILKQELKHIIRKLTDWKDFAFANAQKKEAYTHLQIAQADPQTKICKRVQFSQLTYLLCYLKFQLKSLHL